VEASGQYGVVPQEDKNMVFDFGFTHSLWIFDLAPNIAYTKHTSNQNFLRFRFFGDTNPTFVAKNYDYSDLTLSVPIDLRITKKWAVGGAVQIVKRDYADRPPRDSANEYVAGEKQSNTLTTLTGGIRKRLNDVAMVRITYSLVVGVSNNHFEKYLPYNYTGQTLGIAYQLAY